MPNYIQVPPDSTGKKVRNSYRVDLVVENTTAIYDVLQEDSLITGLASSATGYYTGKITRTDGSITLYIQDVTGTFADGEEIQYLGQDVADIVSTQLTYTQENVLIDPDNPGYHNKVSKEGSLYVRFQEGDQSFDAFGNNQGSGYTELGHHLAVQYDDTTEYYTETVTGGNLLHIPEESMTRYQVNTTSGSRVSRTTLMYHPYDPGFGNQALTSMAVGDTGKDGVIRRWGYYDSEDGIFFELSGSTLCVVLRTSTSGTPVDTKVIQSDWNGDQLTDVNLHKFVLDVSKNNIYWLDLQWLGAGRVRMGVIAPDGSRVLAHSFRNANANDIAYMKRGTLPLKWEIFNETASASTSEMKVGVGTVLKQLANSQLEGKTFQHTHNLMQITGSAAAPMMSFRSVFTQNGIINRTVATPTSIEVIVSGSDSVVDVIQNPSSLPGSTFAEVTGSYSTIQIDDVAT